VPPAADQVNASVLDSPDPTNAVWVFPSQLLTVEVLRRPVESALAAVVAVTDQACCGVALADGHVEGVQDEFGAQVVSHRPSDDATGERVQDHRQIEPALVGALLGDVGHP
jgi:hypothetical protein